MNKETWENDAIEHLHIFAGLFRDKDFNQCDVAQREYMDFIRKIRQEAYEKGKKVGFWEGQGGSIIK